MTYYQCNMSQESAEMAAIFTGVQPDVILHCAGSANVGASVVNPMADLDGNLHSLYQLLLALKSFEKTADHFPLECRNLRQSETASGARVRRCGADVPYGLHKHMAEELCEYYNRIHGYRIRSIRIFLLTATDCASSCGTSIRNIRTPEESNCSGTGEETRDFIHVSDIVRAIELILAYDGPGEYHQRRKRGGSVDPRAGGDLCRKAGRGCGRCIF